MNKFPPRKQKLQQAPQSDAPYYEPRQKKSQSSQSGQNQARKKIPKSMILESVNPQDFMRYRLQYACEDCSHFDSQRIACSLGYKTQHLREDQLKLYELCGRMKFCRFMEID